MTEVAGTVKQVGQGLTQKTYSYEPLNALIDIITNTAGTSRVTCFLPSRSLTQRTGQVVQATVQKPSSSGGGASSAPSATATPITLPISSSTGTA
jgi:hypothetical protein